MSTIKCDILVIGTGPAGAISSYFAAEQGANVLMVDKKSEVGVPVRCGEGVPGQLLDDFEIDHSKEWVPNHCKSIRLVPPKGKDILVEVRMDICILNRDRFEKMLVERSKRKGTKVMLGTTAIGAKRGHEGLESVTLSQEGKEDVLVRPRVVIAADGVESRVGRWAGIRTHISPMDIGSCAQHLVEHDNIDTDVIEFFFGKQYVPHGYGWVFPKGKTMANVGIGLLPIKGTNSVKTLAKFMEKRVKGGRKLNFTVGCIPSSALIAESVKGNVMLVGDSARQVMALTGAGIANAFLAGRIAGRIAGKVANGNGAIGQLQEYDHQWRKSFGKKLERSYKYRSSIARDEKKLNRFFGKIRLGMNLYKLAPKFIGNRIFSGLMYKDGGK